MLRWHVVTEREQSIDPEEDVKTMEVWTISRDPTKTGWETDGGFPGYGLTFADAKELSDAANYVASKAAVPC